MGIYKKTSGLVFDDRFNSGSIHSRYLLSPSNTSYLDTDTEQLILTHTDDENYVLFDIPDDESSLLLEVTSEYVPTERDDEGGIVVWKDGESRLEFIESTDTTEREYSKWRALKKGNKWTFFADKGSGWELIDTDTLVAEKLGVALKNADSQGFVPMKIDSMVLCRSDKITVGNLPEGFTVFLCDSDGNSVASSTVERNWTGVEIVVPSMPFYGILRVYDENGLLVSSLGSFDIYGGDVFLHGTGLKVLWKGTELNVTSDTYLGTMYDDVTLVQMEVFNPEKEKTANDIKLRILKYMEMFGYEWAEMCHDIDGSPTMEFDTIINLESLEPLQTYKFWMKVERKSEHFSIKPMNFILDISHI